MKTFRQFASAPDLMQEGREYPRGLQLSFRGCPCVLTPCSDHYSSRSRLVKASIFIVQQLPPHLVEKGMPPCRLMYDISAIDWSVSGIELAVGQAMWDHKVSCLITNQRRSPINFYSCPSLPRERCVRREPNNKLLYWLESGAPIEMDGSPLELTPPHSIPSTSQLL